MPTIAGIEIPDTPRPGLGAVFGAAAQNAYGQLRYGLPYQVEKLTNNLTPDDEQFYKEGLDWAAKVGAAAPAASVSDLTSGKVGIGRFIGENLAASLPQTASIAAGAIGGGLIGGPVGAFAGGVAVGAPQFAASNVARSVQEEGGLSSAAAERSLFAAVPQAASDVLVERFLPGAGHFLGGFAAHQTGNFIARTAKSIVKAGATEAVSEAGQQLGERYAAGIPVTGPDAAAEYVNAAVTAFAVGGVLGAGGGFRRSPALVKSAADVTVDDMSAHIAEVLRLPSPTDFTVDNSGVSRANPNTQQLALPSPDRFQQPDAITTPGGVTALNPDAQVALEQDAAQRAFLARQQPPLTPEQEGALAGVVPPTGTALDIAPPQTFDPARFQAPATDPAIGAVLQNQVPNAVANTRLFTDQPIADLLTASRAKDASPELRQHADEEIAHRYAEATGATPLTGDYQARLDDLKHGLRGGFVQTLTATDPQDLVNKVYDEVFENQNTAANVQKLAQRVGLLDDKLQPTATANAIEATRTTQLQASAVPTVAAPAVPLAEQPSVTSQHVDPAFAAQWDQYKQDAGITRLRSGADIGTPPNLQAAQATVFRALGEDKSNAEVSQVEKLARKMGLVTDNDAMDVTPLGRQAFLNTPEGLEETVSAARQQGFTGAQASIFDRGVKAQAAGADQGNFDNFEDRAAYEAGKVWAKDFVTTPGTKTLTQTDAIRARQGARATGVAVDQRTAERAALSPVQVQQQALNRVLDGADLRTVNDSDVARLRRMVRDGAPPEEVSQALQDVQGGKTLFVQPAAITTPLSPLPTRGQPVFKEMNTAEEPGRTANRAETEAAVQSYDLRNQIEAARTAGAITDARAEKLHGMLDAGNTTQVANNMHSLDTRSKGAVGTFREDSLLGGANTALEQALTGKSFAAALEHMVEVAPSPAQRAIMEKVQGLAKQIMAADGHRFDLKIVKPGDTIPASLDNSNTRAIAEVTQVPPRSTVWLKSADLGPESGTNYQVVAHEMIHAVTMQAIEYANTTDPEGKTPLGVAVKGLMDLARKVDQHINRRLDTVDGSVDLSDFEIGAAAGDHNAFDDPHELIAWGLTNPEMQKYLQSIEFSPRQSVFSKFVDLVRNVLGLAGQKYNTALTELLRVSEQIFGQGARDLAPAFARDNPLFGTTATLRANASEAGTSAANRTAQALDNQMSTLIRQVTDKVTKEAAANFVSTSRDSLRKFGLGLFSRHNIDSLYGEMIPGVLDNTRARETRVATRNIFQLVGENVAQTIDKLKQSGDGKSVKDYGRINNLMQVAQYGIDGAKSWDEHAALHDEPNAENLKEIWEQAHQDYGTLARHGNVGIFEEARAANMAQNFGHMLGQIYDRIATDEQFRDGISGSEISPADTLIDTEGLTTAKALRDHLAADLDGRIAVAKAYLETQSQSAASLPAKERLAADSRTASLGALLNEIASNRTQMAEQPYFHLPRFGDHFAAFSIAKDVETGLMSKAALVRVAAELAKLGVDDVQISADNMNPRVMIRTDNKSTAALMGQLGLELEAQGFVEKGTTRSGPRSREDNYGLGGRVPDYLAQALERVDTDPTFQPDQSMSRAEQKALRAQLAAAKQALVDGWLDMQPSNSLSKVLAKRRNVQGAANDMIRGFAHRQNIGAMGVATLLTRPKFSDALRSMRATVEESHDANSKLDPYITSQVVGEIRRRDADVPVNEVADSFDKVRAVANTSYLGLNPSSAVINMTALGTTVLPELAKRNGYTRSFHAMRRASVQAASILTTAFADAQSRGAGHRADLSLTEGVLAKAKLPNDVREFVRKRIAAGDIDLATMARALGQIAEGRADTLLNRALRYGSAFNLYSEAFARLTAVIAARELHGGVNSDEAHAYARSVVKESLMSFGPGDTARHLGKHGLLGPVTPLVTQFMQWNAQVTEKLFREFRDGIGRQRDGETAEQASARRAESRKFLAGHFAAMTALAGTLGLPFATVFASAIEKVFGSEDEPFDATAAYRNFLNSIFGKGVGEVVARGLPRALGFDISRRAGEQDLLPGSEIISNKGTWTEAVQNSTGRSIGAAPNMILSVLDGGSQVAHGDVLSGMKAILPVALKNPIEAYRMTTDGYINSRGTKLPMTPGAAAIMWQLLGFAPSGKAEYSEARGDQQARFAALTQRATSLRQGIVRALTNGDQDRARSLISDAQTFDADNPSFAMIPSLASSLQKQQQAQAQARALKSPLGVSVQDIAGQALTKYANVDYSARAR